MDRPSLIIPGTEHTPSIRVLANPLYALFQYLLREDLLPADERNPAFAQAAALMARARHLQGVHGIWDVWEQPLAAADTVDEANLGLTNVMTETVNQLSGALREAEASYRAEIWPERQPLIEAALATLRDTLLPQFATMARRQAELLDLLWPDTIDAYLVPESYAWEGAYSHPLTIDVSANTGLTLCETLLHEATHVADVYTAESGRQSLRDRLTAALAAQGIPPPLAWNAWHGVIFAASGYQVRTVIDREHVDYALPRQLYQWLKVPDLPTRFGAFAEGEMDEEIFIAAVAGEVHESSASGARS